MKNRVPKGNEERRRQQAPLPYSATHGECRASWRFVYRCRWFLALRISAFAALLLGFAWILFCSLVFSSSYGRISASFSTKQSGLRLLIVSTACLPAQYMQSFKLFNIWLLLTVLPASSRCLRRFSSTFSYIFATFSFLSLSLFSRCRVDFFGL